METRAPARSTAALAVVVAAAALAPATRGEDRAATVDDRPVRAATWIEGEGAGRTLVVALFRAALPQRRQVPELRIAVGIALDSERVTPDYGTLHAADWRTVPIAPGEVIQARVALRDRGTASVLVGTEPAQGDVDVHDLIHGELPDGAFFFDRVHDSGAVHVDCHLLPIGGTATLRLDAPQEEGFFREETFEIVRIARRLAIDGGDPDGPSGSIRVTRRAPAAEDSVTLLEGEAGEKRIRGHFEKPDCNWAERHVGWMKDLFVFEYLRPTALEFTLDASTAKRPGTVSDTWNDYGALCWESIWPNGFGGSSSNLDLPAILVVPKDAPVRDVTLDR